MNPQNLPGQPHLAYRSNELFFEEVRLSDLAKGHGTPLFVYSKGAMLSALAAYQRGFAGRRVQICYAMKANPFFPILAVLCAGAYGRSMASEFNLRPIGGEILA